MQQLRHTTDSTQMNTDRQFSVSASPAERLARALLRVPLFYKLLVANLAIVAAVAVVGTFAGFVAVALANALILRFALRPLEQLEEAAARVQAGEMRTRAAKSSVGDAAMDRVVDTFNAMLDSIEDYQRKQRDVSLRALNAAEEERKRVAADLHDKTAQTLAGLLVRLTLAKSINDDEVRSALLKEAADEASLAMDEVYRVVQVLRPPALEMLGLKGAIETHARSVAHAAGIDIDVESEDLRGTLDPQAEIAVYRILQEALSNVLRHSGATRAVIKLARHDGDIVATIEDNGVGFAAEQMLLNGKSLGLFGMQERASYLGGAVEIRSGSGGTTVEVQIPVS